MDQVAEARELEERVQIMFQVEEVRGQALHQMTGQRAGRGQRGVRGQRGGRSQRGGRDQSAAPEGGRGARGGGNSGPGAGRGRRGRGGRDAEEEGRVQMLQNDRRVLTEVCFQMV